MNVTDADQEVIDALAPEERYDALLPLLREVLGDEGRWLFAALDRTVWELVCEREERWGLPFVIELIGSQPPHVVSLLEAYGLQTGRLGVA